MIKFIIMLAMSVLAVAQQFPGALPNCTATRTTNCLLKTDASGTYVITGSLDASGATHTLPSKKGLTSAKPASCTVGEEYFATDATAGSNKYLCTASNTWTQQTGGSGDASGTYVITGSLDASGATHTLPSKKGLTSAKPASCTVGEEYFATDATAGSNKYLCTASNTWTQQTGGSGDASGTYVITGSLDASGATHTLPSKKGLTSAKPASCTVGEEYFATDATAGSNKYLCTASNTWTQQTGGSGGSSANATMTIDLPAGGVGSGIVTGPWDLGYGSGGGNSYYHGLDFADSGTPGYKATFRLPANFDKTKTVSVIVTGSNVNGKGGAVLLTVKMACFGVGHAVYLPDPTYGTAASVTITQTADGKTTEGTAASLPLAAACDSNKMARVLVSRDNTVPGNMTDVYSVLDVALTYGAK